MPIWTTTTPPGAMGRVMPMMPKNLGDDDEMIMTDMGPVPASTMSGPAGPSGPGFFNPKPPSPGLEGGGLGFDRARRLLSLEGGMDTNPYGPGTHPQKLRQMSEAARYQRAADEGPDPGLEDEGPYADPLTRAMINMITGAGPNGRQIKANAAQGMLGAPEQAPASLGGYNNPNDTTGGDRPWTAFDTPSPDFESDWHSRFSNTHGGGPANTTLIDESTNRIGGPVEAGLSPTIPTPPGGPIINPGFMSPIGGTISPQASQPPPAPYQSSPQDMQEDESRRRQEIEARLNPANSPATAEFNRTFDQRNAQDMAMMDMRRKYAGQAQQGYGNHGLAQARDGEFTGAPVQTSPGGGRESMEGLMGRLAGYNPAVSPREGLARRGTSAAGVPMITDGRLRIPQGPETGGPAAAEQKWQEQVDDFHTNNPMAGTVMIGKKRWTPEMQQASPDAFESAKRVAEARRDSPERRLQRQMEQERMGTIQSANKTRRAADEAQDRGTRMARIQFNNDKIAGRRRAEMAGPIAMAKAQAEGELAKHPKREGMSETLKFIGDNYGPEAAMAAMMGAEGAGLVPGLMKGVTEHRSRTGSGYGPPPGAAPPKPAGPPAMPPLRLRDIQSNPVGDALSGYAKWWGGNYRSVYDMLRDGLSGFSAGLSGP